MLIGVDFDNTIICYDLIFHRIGCDWGAVPKELPARKDSVRDYLIQKGQNDLWTELQGYVYGHGIIDAEPFPGVMDFFLYCRRRGLPVCIVSHKTEFPKRGRFKANLREAALAWLEANRFLDTAKTGLTPSRVYFEPERAEKNWRIGRLGVTHFIDDLVEVFDEDSFPARTRKILFLPHGDRRELDNSTFRSWAEIKDHFTQIGAA